jgi:hypothetical protein
MAGRIFIKFDTRENRVLRIIFGPKRDEVTGKWKKLYNEELRYFTHPQISLGRSSKGRRRGWVGTWHA